LATFTRALRRRPLLLLLLGLCFVLPASWASRAGGPGQSRTSVLMAGFGGAPAPHTEGFALDATSTPPPAGAGVTAAQADRAMSAFDRAFYVESGGRGFFRATSASASPAPFWRSAELIELVEDAWQHSHRPVYETMLLELRRGIVSRYGGAWTAKRIYNDDVMWMVIAFVRGYEITGRREFLGVARRNFDAAYGRGWSGDFGGGLWWTTDRHEKNACVAGPAAIAAWHLYGASGDAAYLAKARSAYAWLRRSLFDSDLGAVYDHVSLDATGQPVVDRSTYTYNQGTVIGAADLLYRASGNAAYADDARKALQFARSGLTVGGLLREEGVGRDGGGFKGIFARYAVLFAARNGLTDFTPWFAQNAAAAWATRDERGLMGQDWSGPTSAGTLHAFDASSAVVLLQQLRPQH
jgi:predicted alpha-1,6-mannanase (GH76 family)